MLDCRPLLQLILVARSATTERVHTTAENVLLLLELPLYCLALLLYFRQKKGDRVRMTVSAFIPVSKLVFFCIRAAAVAEKPQIALPNYP